MIIWGWRGVTSTKDKGRFHCPECAAKQPYAHKQVRTWFTLYFIPIIPLAKRGDYVECQRCKGTYRAEVLSWDPEAQDQAFVAEYQSAMLAVMASMLLADGEVDKAEVTAARDIYQRVSGQTMPLEAMEQVIASTRRAGGELIPQLEAMAGGLNERGKEMIVKAAYLIAAADGDIAEEELRFLGRIGQALGMTKAHFAGVLQTAAEA